MDQQKYTLKQSLQLHLRGIRELHRVSPRFFPVTALYALTDALQPYAVVFFSARVLRALALGLPAAELWRWAAACVACTGLLAAGRALLYQRKETLMDDLYGRKECLFIRKGFSMDYADMDDQRTHDLRSQIAESENLAGWGLMMLPEIVEKLLTGLIGAVSGIGLTVSLFTSPVPASAGALTVLNDPLFVLALAAVLLGVSFLAGQCSARAMTIFGEAAGSATQGNRLFSYITKLCRDPSRATDARIYSQQDLVRFYWRHDMVFSANGSLGRLVRGPIGLYQGLGAGMSAFLTGAAYLFTCLKAWAGAFDVGSVTQYVGAVTALAGNVTALTSTVGTMSANAPFLEKTFAYLDIPNAMYQGSLTTEKRSDRNYEVEFRNVSFRYPGTQNWALKNVSMKFKVGARLAIVGENGSGKTTFIKLLCRLYDPQEGQILLNGIDIRKYNYRDYMDIFAVVFQDFQLLSQSLGANVAGRADYDPERVRQALVDAGFGQRLDTMPRGLDTQLYRQFSEDGVDVSGGEAQKIAIARALYRNAPFIILDEPTAALDPLAEAEIYSKFDEISGDRTAIYISHRLSSCKFCDEIAVFQDGRIVQQGTHEALLADLGGKYHALWQAQAQYYTSESA